MWDVPARWDPSRPGTPVRRLQVWSQSELVDDVLITDGSGWADDFIDGAVTETRATGVHATLSLSVAPSDRWCKLLKLPVLELLPFAGMSWGREEYTLPLGVFPVRWPGLGTPRNSIKVSAQDHWQYVASAKLLWPRFAPGGLIRDAVASLIGELGIGAGRLHPVRHELVRTPLVTATSTATMAVPTVWQGSRHQIIADLAESIAGEAFIDRYGQPIVRDRTTQPGRDLSDGDAGTIITATPTVDESGIVNIWAVGTSNNDVAPFPPATAQIDSPYHPASVQLIGPRSDTFTSPQITSYEQAQQVATEMLAKHSAAQWSYQVECIPDPATEPGDRSYLATGEIGRVPVTVESVTHPLGQGAQSMKLGVAADGQ